MGEIITLTATDGQDLEGYRADPKGDPRGGIVVIQEIFGLNPHIRDVCDRLADQGYLVIAPALFDRIELDIELGYSEEDLKDGLGYMQKVGNETPMLDIQAATDELRKSVSKVGAIGFCWGGQLAWLTAKNVNVDCAVGYYGVAIHQTLDPEPKCPVLLHFAEKDVFVPKDAIDKVRTRYPDMEVYSYPANHGFNCDRREDFHEESAKQAMERTLTFFAQHVGN